MNDETILSRGGTEHDIEEYAKANGADLTMTHQEEVESYEPWHEDLQVLMEEYWEVWSSSDDAPTRRAQFDKLKAFITSHANARVREVDPVRVGMLRQWINEDRIINNPRGVLVSNGEIMYWLTGDEKYLSTGEETTSDWKNSEDRKKLIDAADKAGAVFRRTMGEETNNTSV